tara:strand:+ start:94 stop:489 length:396 start_codon:yes stop_codon:yes gene_type:complete
MNTLFKNLFSLVLIFSIFLVNFLSSVYAIENVNWILLKENLDGKQWLDKGSLKRYKNNEISVLTKYFQNPAESEDKGITSLYVMRINCNNNQFKDTSINGIPNINAKWKTANNDELIDIVIKKSCSEASDF